MRVKVSINQDEAFVLHNEETFDKNPWFSYGCETNDLNIDIEFSALKNLMSSGKIYDVINWIEENGYLCLKQEKVRLHQETQENHEKYLAGEKRRIADQEAQDLKEHSDYSSGPGYIYLIKAANGLYKIGLTGNIKSRFTSLQVGSPVKLELKHSLLSDHVNLAESYLHNKYSSKRRNGEWFELTDDEVAEICSIQDGEL